MAYVIQGYTVMANALYAAEENFLRYEDIDEYRKLLYKTINKKYRYIMFQDTEDSIIEIHNHTFVRMLGSGVHSFNQLDDVFMECINSIYPEDIQEMILLANTKFKDVRKKLIQKRIKEDIQPQIKKGALAN